MTLFMFIKNKCLEFCCKPPSFVCSFRFCCDIVTLSVEDVDDSVLHPSTGLFSKGIDLNEDL